MTYNIFLQRIFKLYKHNFSLAFATLILTSVQPKIAIAECASINAGLYEIQNLDLTSSFYQKNYNNIIGSADDEYILIQQSSGGSVATLAGNDAILICDSSIDGRIDTGSGMDAVIIDGNVSINKNLITAQGSDTVYIFNGLIDGFVLMDDQSASTIDSEVFQISGGEVGKSVSTGPGHDSITLGGGVINGSIYALEGDDSLFLDGSTIKNNIYLGNGSDIVLVDSGRVEGSVHLGDGEMQNTSFDENYFTLNGGIITGKVDGDAGNDTFRINGGVIEGSVISNAGSDTVFINGGEIAGNLLLGEGSDVAYLQEGSVGGFVILGNELETTSIRNYFTMYNGYIQNGVISGSSNDSVVLRGGQIDGNINLSDGDDVVAFWDDDAIFNNDIYLGKGSDILYFKSGTMNGTVFLGLNENDNVTNDKNTFNMLEGSYNGSVFGDNGSDTFNLTGGNFRGSLVGNGGSDTITINGAVVEGNLILGGGEDTALIYHGIVDGFVFMGLSDSSSIENEVVQINSSTVTRAIYSGAGDDYLNIGHSVLNGEVNSGAGDDMIHVANSFVNNHIRLGLGSDSFTIAYGDINGTVFLGENDSLVPTEEQNDFTSFNGQINGRIVGSPGIDRFEVAGGYVRGSVHGGSGDDVLSWSGGNLRGLLDGGDGYDTFNFNGIQKRIDVGQISNWENININGGKIDFSGNQMTLGNGLPLEMRVNQGGIVTFGPIMAFNGNMFIESGSSVEPRTRAASLYSINGSLENDGSLNLINFNPNDEIIMSSYSGNGDIYFDIDTSIAVGDGLVIGEDADGLARLNFKNLKPNISNGQNIDLIQVSGENNLQVTLGTSDISAGAYDYTLTQSDGLIFLKATPVSERMAYSAIPQTIATLPIFIGDKQSQSASSNTYLVSPVSISTSGATHRHWDLSLTAIADQYQKDLTSFSSLKSWTTGVRFNAETKIFDAPGDLSKFRLGLLYSNGETLIFDGIGESSITSTGFSGDVGVEFLWGNSSHIDISTGIILEKREITTYDDDVIASDLWSRSYFVDAEYGQTFAINENSQFGFSMNMVGAYGLEQSFYDNKNNRIFIDNSSSYTTSAKLRYAATFDSYSWPSEFESTLQLRKFISPESSVRVNEVTTSNSSETNSVELGIGLTANVSDDIISFLHASHSFIFDKESESKSETTLSLGLQVKW